MRVQAEAEAQTALRAANEEADELQEELAATQKSVSADSTALETIRRDCSSKAAEWDARPGELL